MFKWIVYIYNFIQSYKKTFLYTFDTLISNMTWQLLFV